MIRPDAFAKAGPLMDVLEEFTHFCLQNNLTYWAIYGTLIGAVRHKSVIPWDYDVDVNMLADDFDKLVTLFESQQNSIGRLRLIRRYYNDLGCTYVHIDYDEEMGVDICSLRREGDTLVTNMSDETVSRYPGVYNQAYDEVFPLRTVFMCGVPVCIPNKTDECLSASYGPKYMEFHPKDYRDWCGVVTDASKRALLVSAPQRTMPEYSDTSLALSDPAIVRSPFIVRGLTNADFPTADTLITSLLSQSAVDGYAGTAAVTEAQHGEQLVARWRSGDLSINVVDSHATDPRVQAPVNAFPPGMAHQTSYLLTKANNLTPFHVDPPRGAGWMWLAEGRKVWWVLQPEDTTAMAEKGWDVDQLSELNFTELVSVADGYLWGKVWVGECGPGDFVYFPMNCPHRTLTYNRAIGVAGYVEAEPEKLER